MFQKNNLYHTLVHSLPDIVFKINPEGIFTFLNDSIQRLGYKKEELIGTHFSALLHPNDIDEIKRSEVLPKFQNLKTGDNKSPKLFDERRTGKRITKNLRIRLLDKGLSREQSSFGEVVSIGTQKEGTRDQVEFTGTVGIIRDITQNVRTEDSLLHLEKYYRSLINNSSDILTILAIDGTILFKSECTERVLNYKSVDLIGENEYDFIHPTDAYKIKELFTRENHKSGNQFIEYSCRTKDGNWVILESSVNQILDGSGEVATLVLYSRDITDRKKTEDALKESEERFSLFMDFLPVAVFIKEMDSKAVYLNQYMKNEFGAEHWLGKYPCEQFPSGIADFLISEDKKTILNGYTESEKAIPDKRGQDRIFKIHKFVINRGNKSPLIGGFALDITSRKDAEEKIRNSLQEKEILLTEVHHRVKNNLQIISSLLHLQSNFYDDPKILSALQVTQNRIKSIALTHEKLYQSKDFARIDLSSYIKELASNLFRSLDSFHVQLSIKMDCLYVSMNTAIYCGLIINELVTNSLKHAFPKGNKGKIKIEFEKNRHEYILTHSDNGVGLPKKIDLKKSSTLGLNLVHNLVDQLKGRIELERAGGTIFRLYFSKEKSIL